MRPDYPVRPPGPAWARYTCMIFGLLTMIGGFVIRDPDRPIFVFAAGILVGAAWFAFGAYGGLPLVDTVKEWHRPASLDKIDALDREGLRVMRRRRWLNWLLVPVGLAAMALLTQLLNSTGQPEIVLLLVGPPLGILSFRYLLSRCPRCGYGFFARSTNRMALLVYRKNCAHCGLPLNAYKETLGTARRGQRV